MDWQWICSRLEILARTRNSSGEEHGRLLAWRDLDGKRHEWAMPNRLLAGDGTATREILLSSGVEIAPGNSARQALGEYLGLSRPERTARCVSRPGWHSVGETSIFVLPDGTTFGESGPEQVVFQTPTLRAHRFAVSGTLEQWKEEIGARCSGNTRLLLAVSTAFAGPLLYITGSESGGIHLFGHSSKGKSTVLQVAGSVWGGGGVRGFVQSWRATDNGLEGEAARGVAACFEAWLATRGTSGPVEDSAALAQVRRFFEQHGESRFTPWNEPNKTTLQRAGFRRANEEGETEWYVLPEAWRTEVCAGFDSRRVAKLGIEAGWLVPDSQGKPTSSHRLPGLKPTRVYRVTSAVLSGDASHA